jgi:hypothetical protein
MAKVAQLKTEVESSAEMISYEAPSVPAGRIRILVESKCPLLTHNPASMYEASETKKGGNIPKPEDEAEAATYRLDDGTCAVKGEGFRASLLDASSAYKVPKKRYSARAVLEHITVIEDLVPLTRRDGTPIRDYAIDAKRVIIQGNGIIRHRPRFDEWRATFTIEFDPLLWPQPKVLIDILADAGNRKGVGDYRPRYGRFIVLGYWLE